MLYVQSGENGISSAEATFEHLNRADLHREEEEKEEEGEEKEEEEEEAAVGGRAAHTHTSLAKYREGGGTELHAAPILLLLLGK